MDKQADLRKWFKEKWVDISRKKKGGGHPECGRDDADDGGGYPKCRPARAAARMSKKQKSYAVRAKRSKPQGVGGKPTMVATFKKKAMFNPEVNNILESLEKEAEKFDPKNNPKHRLIADTYWTAPEGVKRRKDLIQLASKKHRKGVAKAMDATDNKPKLKDRLRYGARGAALGGILGAGYGASMGPAFARHGKEGKGALKGALIGGGLGAAAGGAAAAKHGGKDAHRFEQVLKAQGITKKACFNPEVDRILENLEKEASLRSMGVAAKRMIGSPGRKMLRTGMANPVRTAAGIGAAAGAVRGAMKPGTNPDGTQKSRLSGMARGAAVGGALGAGAGYGASKLK